MIHFLDESSRQKLRNLLTDCPTLLFIEAAEMLLYRLGAQLDPQGMLSNFPRNAWHIQGFPCEDVTVRTEEVDENAFLFGGEVGADAQHLVVEAAGVYEDLLGALCGLKRLGRPLGVGCFLGSFLPDDRKLLGGDGHHGELIALHLAFVSALEGGADGDDPAWAQHLELEVCVVGDGHELCIAWVS
jgi:hypothetical protein